MKNWSKKLISLLLMIALTVSMFTVFAFAEDGETDVDDTEDDLTPIVVHNRDYADGWSVYNGVGVEKSHMKNHNFHIDYEITADYSKNYFVRMEAADTFATKGANNTDGFIELSFSKQNYPHKNHAYVEFDIKIDDICSLGSILYFRTEGGSTAGTNEQLLHIVNNELIVFPSRPEQMNFPIGDEWMHVMVDFDYTNPNYDDSVNFDINLTVNGITTTRKITTGVGHSGIDILRFGLPPVSNDTASKDRAGISYCLDNIQAYCNTNRPLTEAEIDAQGYGTLVNTDQIKTVIIDGAESSKTTQDYLNESLCMKVGVNYALLSGKQVDIIDGGDPDVLDATYGAPVEIDGKIFVPFQIVLDYIGTGYFIHEDGKSYDISTGVSATYITMGRDLATVNGEVVSLTAAPGYYTDPYTNGKYAVIALDDIETILPGYYVTYDSMGLIIIGSVDNILTRENNLTEMLDLMGRFVYNFIDADSIYEIAKENTNNFTHPYLLGGQEVYDRLIAIYNGTDTKEYDVDLKTYITAQVKRAYDLYKIFALPDPLVDENGEVITDADGNIVYGTTYNKYTGLNWSDPNTQKLIYPHVATNGYDPTGGRQGESGTVTGWTQDIAFGYIITGDIKLAQLTYDMLVEVGEWNHWCPGHFLNTADAAQKYAISFDWIYNGIAALEKGEYDDTVEKQEGILPSQYYRITYLEELLYKNGVRMGYLSVKQEHHGWIRPQGDVWNYQNMGNNWNGVCTCGMWLASFMLMGSELYGDLGKSEGQAPYRETAAFLISSNLKTLALNGMGQYAPDGSYVEGPGYWGYGTNSIYLGLMSFWRILGDDYGILDAPGMDKTCYFVFQAESSEYNQFSYHDSGVGGAVDTSSFYFVAEAMNDPVLAQIRKLHNNNGKGMNYRDFLFYPFDNEDSDVIVELPLDYYMEGIDAFVTRSSWDKGALYAGIIAGPNNASHGQVDSGSFVYHNGGINWIMDIGSDEYDIYGYFGGQNGAPANTRYRYYRMNAEGHNLVALTSQPDEVPFGQILSTGGEITDWFANEYGSYTIIDNTASYGSFANTARRGMLLTNDRKTLVIQDEINLTGVETLYWLAHFNMAFNDGGMIYLDYEIESSGRRMYLYQTDKNWQRTGKILRLSIVSNNSYEKFTVTGPGLTEEDRLLKGPMGTVDMNFSTESGALKSEKSRDTIKRIAIKSYSNTMRLAVVIEMIESKNDPLGYTRFTPMNEWVPTADPMKDDGTVEKVPTRANAKLSTISSSVKNIRNYFEMERQFTGRFEEYYAALSDIYYTYIRFYDEDLVDYLDDLVKYEDYKKIYDEYIGTANERAKSATDLAQMLMGV